MAVMNAWSSSNKSKHDIAIIAGQLVVGGAERQLYLWLSHLDRERFRPVVLTLHPNCGDYWESAIEALGIPILRVSQSTNRLGRLFDIVRAFYPYKPALVHGWHLFASPYAGLVAKLLGAKSLGSIRGSFQAFRDSTVQAQLTLWLVDAILVNSASVAEKLKAVRRRNQQVIYTVQNAVRAQANDFSVVKDELSRRFGFSPTSVLLGSLGRLDPGKRFDLLLKVLALLRNNTKNFHFLLIGDGPERRYLENMAKALDLSEYVTFAGEVPNAGDWLGVLDIFCFTSLSEGLPNAVMEAAAAGVPIVSWHAPFMEELLKNDEMVLLIEPENYVAFKNALIKLINSPAMRDRLGQAARDHMLRQFALDRFVREMTNVYEDLLGIRSSANVGEA